MGSMYRHYSVMPTGRKVFQYSSSGFFFLRKRKKDVSPDTCAVGVANQRTDSLSLSFPDIRYTGTGSKTPIFGRDRG